MRNMRAMLALIVAVTAACGVHAATNMWLSGDALGTPIIGDTLNVPAAGSVRLYCFLNTTDIGNTFEIMVGYDKSDAAAYGVGVDTNDGQFRKLARVDSASAIAATIDSTYFSFLHSVLLDASGIELANSGIGGRPYGFVARGSTRTNAPLSSRMLFSFTLRNDMSSTGDYQYVVISNCAGADSYSSAWKMGISLKEDFYALKIVTGAPRQTVGVTNKAALAPIMQFAAANYNWVLWGKVNVIDADSFTLDDGSSVNVKVISESHGLLGGEFVSVKGTLEVSVPMGPVLTSIGVMEYVLPAPEPVRLNNLTSELSVKTSLQPLPAQMWTFNNPRDGWVFFSCDAQAQNGVVSLSIDSIPKENAIIVVDSNSVGPVEAMRHLKAGDHKVRVYCDGAPTVSKVIIRAVPELIYCEYPVSPLLGQSGGFDWDIFQRDVGKNINCMSAHDYYGVIETDLAGLQTWKDQGKKWIFNAHIPGWSSEPLGDSYSYWYNHPGFQHPLADGIICDEFVFGGTDSRYATWTTAINQIYQDPNLRDKTFYGWTAAQPMYGGPDGLAFLATLASHGGKVAPEYYPSEPPTVAGVDAVCVTIKSDLLGWKNAHANGLGNVIATLGYMSRPNESQNIDATVDFKVLMDRMMVLIASDQQLSGIYGIMWYMPPYCDEENVRWASRLFRHYCIEGKTNMLSDEMGFSYNLNHIMNPDFENGLSGWIAIPAEAGSITTITQDGWSWLQGRYPATTKGNTCLLMKSKSTARNVVTQQINNLVPGRLYSLKMFTGDRQDMLSGTSIQRANGITITIGNADLLPERCSDKWIDNCWAHWWGGFNDVNKYWFTYRNRVFRATGTTAALTISDWLTPSAPGVPVGRENMVNFVEVQPYYLD